VVRDHPARAHRAPDLFVRLRQQDHVAIERHALALEAQKRDQLRDALALHVHRAAGPELVALNGRHERIGFPLRAIGRHDVHVMKQDDSLASRRRHGGLQPREHDRLARRRFVACDRDAVALEDAGEKIGGLARIARRIRRIDGDVFP